MGILNKTLIVTDIENYKSSDATFKSGRNDTGIDPIRNYFGFHHTERLAVYGAQALSPGYNPLPAGAAPELTVRESTTPDGRDEKMEVRGGEDDLTLHIIPPPPDQVDPALADGGTLKQELFLTCDHEPIAGSRDTPDRLQGLRAFSQQIEPKINNSAIGVNSDHPYYDHTFSTDLPLTKKQIEASNVTFGASYYDAGPKYNYYSKNYENVIAGDTVEVPETLLPNAYAFVCDAMTDRDSDEGIMEPTDYSQLISLQGRIASPPSGIGGPRGRALLNETATKMGVYLDKYYYAVEKDQEDDWLSNNQITTLSEKYKKLLFSDKSKRILRYGYMGRDSFPMYNRVSFNLQKDIPTVDFLSHNGYTTAILKEMEATDPPATTRCRLLIENKDLGASAESADVQREDERLRLLGLIQGEENPLGSTLGLMRTFESSEKELIYHELDMTSLAPTEAEFDGVYYKQASRERERSGVERFITRAASTAQFHKTYLKYRRSYIDILLGRPAHHEVMAYKIEKYSTIDPEAPALVSTTIVPNQGELDVLNFVDTQVRYGESYKYVVKQMVLVFGSKIEFKTGDPIWFPYRRVFRGWTRVDGLYYTRHQAGRNDLPQPFDERAYAYATVEVNPSIRVYEVPYFSTRDLRIVVDPPSPPQVEFITYKGVDNKVLININNALDEYVDYPAILDEIDRMNVDEVKNAQNDIYNGKIKFSGRTTGTEVDEFIVYRTDVRPRGYSMFGGSELATIGTSIEGLKSSCGAYVSTLMPNKKYYYIVRTLDVHGFRSNPTTVYEVEIVSNSGTIYPIIKTVKLGPQNDGRKMSRPMRKYLQVKPSFLQTFAQMGPNPPMGVLTLDDLDSPDPLAENGEWTEKFSSLVIGGAAQPIWGKSFKIRLTSKQTGKKLDFNMTFRLRKDNS